MPNRKPQRTKLDLRPVRPQLPGPWQYLDLLPMIRLMDQRLRDAPALAYPLLALVVWRAIRQERERRAKAILDAHREAIRRSQQIWVVQPPKRRRFLVF